VPRKAEFFERMSFTESCQHMKVEVDVVSLMRELRRGDRDAAAQLVDRFYPELKRLALKYMQDERPGHTWQATVLVNEMYLELCRIRQLEEMVARTPEQERGAFFCLAAHIMRRLLIAHARPLRKRAVRVPDDVLENVAAGEEAFSEVADVLDKLGALDPKLRQVVELKVFEGLSTEQIADRLGCAPRSVARYWGFARGWMANALSDSSDVS
jgi:RNA polymerase sigma factor (TIGR02999 family)